MRSALQVRVFKLMTAFMLLLASAIPGISALDAQTAFAANTTYYVSNSTGNDSNNGTSQSTAWKTMAKVSGITFQPGDRILLKSGDTWNEKLTLKGSGTKASPITITSYGTGNKPIISANVPWSGVIYGKNLSHWLIKGLAVKAVPSLNMVYTDRTTGILVDYDTTALHAGLQIDSNEIYSTTPDSNTYGIQIVAYVPGSSYGAVANDIVISNNNIHDVGYYAITTGGWNTAGATNFLSQETYGNMYVVGNQVTNIGNQGIVVGNAFNSAIERNIVRAAGQANSNGYGPGGLWYISSRDSVIRFNEVSEMGDSMSGYDGAGINIDWYCKNITVQYNYSHDNKGNGFTTMSNIGGKILNNKAKGNKGETGNGKGQIALGNFTGMPSISTGTHNMVVANNTIIVDVAGTTGINSGYWSGGAAPDPSHWTGNSIYRNNIVLKSGVANTSVFDIGINTTIDQIWENKIYSSGSTFTAKKDGTTYNGLWTWQAATGFDSGSFVYGLDTSAPGSVSGVASSLSGGYVQLSWSAATDSGTGGIAHYNIYRGTTPGFTPAYVNMVGESTGTTFLDNARPKSNTTYYYKVEAEDRNGNNGAASAAHTATTGLIP
ncbi:right-handed parallel beta-helix repeat-containing protein [Paenibacillus pasadenensis]|uniref:right-handed parallel beta-helix repeat-containing protein n=1 Tax=Paenibacillus pasadenensis TaxID=217090 RepID=UPI00203DE748|nr:right-handed parallel beta-helix repeat-containing protein [Paenibacillus pasadenensis]MCM3746089.1 right-handed parallel beta-helix repeat-containing protein [Paenibacillus pasadenensis]